ncbi:MAG TPA: DUF1501 domain-containing protein [bacterium]|nr:DUF1501 domain-containing protein [bacterium]
MPGMTMGMMTRKEFLRKGLTIVAAGATAPMFLTRTALALNNPWDQSLTASAAGRADGPVLVVVQLGGGNDGLNTVVPYAHDDYYRARPRLAVPRESVLRVTDEVGFHPGLAPLKALYDDGRLAVVQGAGYPNPNRSHFRSMEIWHTADPDGTGPRTGWLGRLFDSECPSCGPTAGIAMLGAEMPLAMQGTSGRGVVLSSPEAFAFHPIPGAGSAEAEAFRRLMQPVPGEEPVVDFLTHTAMDAVLAADEIRGVAGHLADSAGYPRDPFALRLRLVSELISAGVPTRVYYVGLGGFDTHAAQAGRHDRLMEQLGAGLDAFVNDLTQKGLMDRVLIMSFSEFGRRVAENASDGTDHGAAAPMFLIGGQVAPGIHGPHPSLTDLDQGDLRYGVDFRSVYATVLEQWLGIGSQAILGGRFPGVGVIKPRAGALKPG